MEIDPIETLARLSAELEDKKEPPRFQMLPEFDDYTPELKAAKASTERLVGDALAGESPRWLSLLGVQGTGKTHLAKAAVSAMRENQRTAQLWRWTSITDHLRRGNFNLKRQLFSLPFLAIDDLGSGHDTSFSQAFADELADRRLGKWTIWTSNWSYQQIGDHLSWRVHSRMARDGSTIIEILDTGDYNQRPPQ